MQVRGKTFKGIELGLLEDDARELAHILNLFVIQLNHSTARGSSVENQKKLAAELSVSITERLEAQNAV